MQPHSPGSLLLDGPLPLTGRINETTTWAPCLSHPCTKSHIVIFDPLKVTPGTCTHMDAHMEVRYRKISSKNVNDLPGHQTFSNDELVDFL